MLIFLNKRVHRRIISLMLTSFILIGMFSTLVVVNNVFAADTLELKWFISDYVQTSVGPVAEDLMGDSRLEIVVTGIRRSDGMGIVSAINGIDGAIIWEYEDSNVDKHNPCDIADLNNDGFKEIVVPTLEYPFVLHGNNGTLYWRNTAVDAYTNYQANFDIDGDGYSEIFVNSGDAPYRGYDYITSLDYQGNILNQAWNWHSCWGGLTIGDTNFDGRFELYQGDRSSSFGSDAYTGGGMGVRALDAHTLTPLWNDPTILCSSHPPVLADVDKDGILDVIVLMQTSNGIAVLNSADGSVVTTGGVYRKGRIATHRSHSPPTVYDIDGDGNLELIDCYDSPVRIYDLYDWELDATLPIDCEEPPKVGDVTGDGKLDIIAVTDFQIYIYSYNNSSGNYEQVDYVSGLDGNLNAFTVVQDVDGDGYNELIVTSSMGTVYCFDTPALTPTPGPRSGLQFCSEYKRGAAVFVAPPAPTRPALTDEQPIDNSFGQMVNPTLSIRAADFQGNDMDIVFRTNASGTWQDIQSHIHVPTEVYTASPTNMDSNGTTYYWSVNATDIVTGDWSYNVYRFTTYSNPPTHDAPILVSAGGAKDTLTCYNQSTIDPDGDKVTNIYNWYVNDSSLTNLLLPFDTHPQSSEEGLFTDGFENGFDNWDGNGITNWDRTTSQKHSGSWSAHAGSSDTTLNSDDIDLSAEEGFTVSFWYRDDDIDDNDLVYLQFWDGSTYNNIFELGNTSPEDTWHHYSVWYRTLFDYGISDFHIRFRGNDIDNGENLWIDDVVITVDSVGDPVASAKDYSGYDNHGRAQGPAWTSEGVVGGAYIFDGDDRIIVEENDASLGGDGTWSEISVEFWVKATTNTGTERLIWKHAASSTSTIGYRVDFRAYSSTNRVYWRVYTPTSTVINYYIGSGPRDWHHVVCTYKSGDRLRIYVDGTERMASSTISGNIRATDDGPTKIGYYSGSGDFSGVLDEVRIYPRALSPFQVSERYLETKDGSSSNSTIDWHETETGDEWKCQVTPNDGFGDGEPKFSNTKIIQEGGVNAPPEAHNLTITPLSPVTSDTLVGSYDYFDADGDPEYGTEIMWYKDGVLQPSLNGFLTVSSSLTAKNQTWNFTMRPNDGVEFGTLMTSPSVTILNTPPSLTGVIITPDPAFNSSTLTANPTGWGDDDDDPESYFYQWQILDGSWQDIVGETSQTLSPGNFSRGDYVRVNCTAFDGENNGTSHIDVAWIVDSDPPTHDDPLLVSSYSTNMTDEELICYNQSTTDPDGDEITNIYHWIRDGGSLTTLLVPFETNSSTTAWDYSGYGNDGTVYGATWTGDGIVGGAYEFDGDDVIEIADDPSLGGDDDWPEISVEFWVRPSALVRGTRIISRARPGSTGSYMIGFQTNAPDPYNTLFWGVDSVDEGWVDISDSPDWDPVNDGLVLDVGKWYHVFCTYQSGPGLTIYVNGLERFNMPLAGNIDSRSGQTLFLGYDGGGSWYRYLQGTLDEVRIYPMALTSAQAFQRYIETKDGFSNNSTIVPQETTANEVWTCEVIPFDSWQNGTAKTSNPLTVLAVSNNSRPRIDFYNPTDTTPEVYEGANLNFTHISSDPDGDPLSYSWLIDSVENATSQDWTYSPAFWSAGTHNITLIVSDPGDLSDSQQWDVTVVRQYELIIEVSGNGTTTPTPGTHMFAADTEVDLNAIADPGWTFSEWSGNLTGSENPTTIIMDDNKTVTATFIQEEYTLTINVFGNGSVSRNATAPYYYGDVVELNATADPGWTFFEWSVDLSGSANPETITMDGNKTVNATFLQGPYSLTVNVVGSGTVDLNATGPYYYGDVVELFANVTDFPGWTFFEWSVDLSGSANPETILIDGNKTVNATFIQEEYTLTVNVFGNGSVTKDPDLLNYTYGAEVNLTAVADLGWSFVEWSGDLTGSENPATIIMDGDKVVNVTFLQGPYTLTINVFGNGSVILNATGPYYYGDVVELTAVPDLGWAFSGWSEDLSGSANPETLVMDGDKVVNATFIQETYSLTINVEGSGVVNLNATGPYYYGDVVELNATADVGWLFSVWSGDLTGSVNPETIVMDGDKVVNATFIQEEYTLTINVFGNGTVTKDPDQLNYTYGTEVNLTAVPDYGWMLSQWLLNGSDVGSDANYTVTMDSDYNLTAVFVRAPAYLVIRGLDNGIYYRIYNSTGGSWGNLTALPSGSTSDSPAAAVYSGKLYIVFRGMDGYSIWFGWINLTDNSFSNWNVLSGRTPSAPTLARYGDRLILVVRGLNNRIYYRFYDCVSDDWEGWDVLPSGATCDSPAATVLGDELHIVVRGFSATIAYYNYSLWHGFVNLSTKSFSGWTRLHGSTPSAPTLAVSQMSNTLDLVVRGSNNRIYYNKWNGSNWEGWNVLPNGTTSNSPAATVLGDELHIIIRDILGTTLWHYYISLSTDYHSGWKQISDATPSAPTLTS